MTTTFASTLNLNAQTCTSSGGKTQTQSNILAQIFGTFPYTSETGSSESILNWYLNSFEVSTSSSVSIVFSFPHVIETSQVAINELKKLSGLTWEQLGKVLNVSRRSLHLWASGKPLSPFNEEHLRRLLETIRYIDRGNADINRSVLLQPFQNSSSPLDLLIAGKYEEIKQLLGSGIVAQRAQSKPLSLEASNQRRPQSPESLVGALHDSVHEESSRSRPVKSIRSRRGGTRQ